ncbi:uncharacterized protein LOC128514443 [Clarias gariepinus]|uniref:uncharacterized protein LOC128514443 n=1 Tax=Clarias gariepinus TaxID=13013 RepID=UPI00234C0B35|nr:uncharacterized protein LOC128514443 [Clarias gariepinus]
MSQHGEWVEKTNSRGYTFQQCDGKHVSLTELKEKFPENCYLRKENIPCYPTYVFNVKKVCHVTERPGLDGILSDRGFKGKDDFLWWGLSVTDDDIVNAEKRIQLPISDKFTTSPAFLRESRYGNFCFSFNLNELLNLYSNQFCQRTSPILRVLGTHLYRQEIAYLVLVHPRHIRRYRKYPRLPIDEEFLCGYSQKKISWHCQSPSNEYNRHEEEKEKDDRSHGRPEYFVWDNVSVAFHMNPHWVLRVGHKRLFKSLSVCEVASRNLLKDQEMSVHDAEKIVKYYKDKYN